MAITASERAAAVLRGQAMRGGRFPTRNRRELEKAIRAVGRSKGGAAGRAAVRRYLIRRARAMKLTRMIPDTWLSTGTRRRG